MWCCKLCKQNCGRTVADTRNPEHIRRPMRMSTSFLALRRRILPASHRAVHRSQTSRASRSKQQPLRHNFSCRLVRPSRPATSLWSASLRQYWTISRRSKRNGQASVAKSWARVCSITQNRRFRHPSLAASRHTRARPPLPT